MHVDLEHLADGYDFRPTSAAARARARQAAESVQLAPGDLAIDVGGGRGAHAAEWSSYGALPVLVDPAIGMAAKAAGQPDVFPVRAISQSLPFRDAAVRLVYFHLSLHYGNWEQALSEAHRVLSPGGKCWIWTMGESHHRSSFLARWFPSIGDIDTDRFPDPDVVVSHLRHGWSAVTSGKEVEHKVKLAREWRDAVTAGFVSTLQLIPRDELDRGLVAYDMNYPNPDDEVEYNLTFDWICAEK